jgi:hypothetical protein
MGTTPPRSTGGGSGLGVASALIGGGAVILTGAAIATGVLALGEKGTLDDNCVGGACPPTIDGEPTDDVIGRADTMAVLSTVFGVVGVVAGAAAIVLAIVGAVGSTEPAMVFAPWIDQSGGGLAAGGVF